MLARFLPLWLLLLTTAPLPAQGPVRSPAPPDTAPAERVPLFEKRDLLFAGGFVLGTLAVAPLDRQIAREVQDSTLQANRAVSGVATVFRLLGYPGSVVIGGSLYGLGRLTDRPRLADLGLHTTESILLAEAITVPLKGIVGRARPLVDVEQPYSYQLARGFGEDRYRSFPSGHSTAAFATAAAVTTELAEWWPERKPVIGTVLFSGATLVAVSRLYNNKHWASDVLAGAAIGSFSGWKVVRWNHTHPDNWLNRNLLPALALPNGRGGLTLVWVVN